MSTLIEEALNLLGKRVLDKVTSFQGIVTSISFDLYGCVQVLVHPGYDEKENKLMDLNWFDFARLRIINDIPVMKQPNFKIDKGPSEKPTFNKK